jgi:hypothetical protein
MLGKRSVLDRSDAPPQSIVQVHQLAGLARLLRPRRNRTCAGAVLPGFDDVGDADLETLRRLPGG